MATQKPDDDSIRIEIGDRSEIGDAICKWQSCIEGGEKLSLTFIDGGAYIGGVMLTRNDDDDLAVMVEGQLFQGSGDDRGVALAFRCAADGPEGWALKVRDVDGLPLGTYTDDEEDQETEATLKAAFYAANVSFTAANAPPIKALGIGNAFTSAQVGTKLHNSASKVEKAWTAKLGEEKTPRGSKKSTKWFAWMGRKLVAMTPGTKVQSGSEHPGAEGSDWPRPMPKPTWAVPTSPEKRTSRRNGSAKSSTAEAGAVVKGPAGYVHKRAAKSPLGSALGSAVGSAV